MENSHIWQDMCLYKQSLVPRTAARWAIFSLMCGQQNIFDIKCGPREDFLFWDPCTRPFIHIVVIIYHLSSFLAAGETLKSISSMFYARVFRTKCWPKNYEAVFWAWIFLSTKCRQKARLKCLWSWQKDGSCMTKYFRKQM